MTDKLLNYCLISDRDILHKLGKIFNFKNKIIIRQEVSISMKQPNCTAKEFCVIKERSPVRILDAPYKKIILKSIIMNLNYFKDKHKYSLIEFLQKYEKMFDGTLGK